MGSLKAGLAGFSRVLALEVVAAGVTVNVVAPVYISTDSQLPFEAVAAAAGPIGRSGTPAEIAACVLFLAHESASFVTGTVVVADGGHGRRRLGHDPEFRRAFTRLWVRRLLCVGNPIGSVRMHRAIHSPRRGRACSSPSYCAARRRGTPSQPVICPARNAPTGAHQWRVAG